VNRSHVVLAAEFPEQFLDGGGLAGSGRPADDGVERARPTDCRAEGVLQALELGLTVAKRLGDVVYLEDPLVAEDGLVPREHPLSRVVGHRFHHAAAST
jgi:hypothetical protein